ncbi:MAG: hypothetical protein C3F17_19835, partial [Bradyrhizobiaceae bacterium]
RAAGGGDGAGLAAGGAGCLAAGGGAGGVGCLAAGGGCLGGGPFFCFGSSWAGGAPWASRIVSTDCAVAGPKGRATDRIVPASSSVLEVMRDGSLWSGTGRRKTGHAPGGAPRLRTGRSRTPACRRRDHARPESWRCYGDRGIAAPRAAFRGVASQGDVTWRPFGSRRDRAACRWRPPPPS